MEDKSSSPSQGSVSNIRTIRGKLQVFITVIINNYSFTEVVGPIADVDGKRQHSNNLLHTIDTELFQEFRSVVVRLDNKHHLRCMTAAQASQDQKRIGKCDSTHIQTMRVAIIMTRVLFGMAWLN